MVQPPSDLDSFEAFVKIVSALRGPDGCPWDKEQTHRTLVPYAIEEAFELAEAIESDSDAEVVGELGDVFLQVVLHAEIARQEGRYDIHDVLRGISEKMIRRHPHVFSDVAVGGSADVLTNWAKIKETERAGKPPKIGFGIPRGLPALQRSHKIGDKTAKVGFDWPDAAGVFAKLDEEIGELRAEFAKLGARGGRGPAPGGAGEASDELREALEHEVGDVLFSAAQLARHLGLDGEQALRTANARFEKRYFKMRENVGEKWDRLSDAEKESAWQQAKRETK